MYMNIILQNLSKNKIRFDSLRVSLPGNKYQIKITWDESEWLKEGDTTYVKAKGIYFNGEYANGKLNMIRNKIKSIVPIDITNTDQTKQEKAILVSTEFVDEDNIYTYKPLNILAAVKMLESDHKQNISDALELINIIQNNNEYENQIEEIRIQISPYIDAVGFIVAGTDESIISQKELRKYIERTIIDNARKYIRTLSGINFCIYLNENCIPPKKISENEAAFFINGHLYLYIKKKALGINYTNRWWYSLYEADFCHDWNNRGTINDGSLDITQACHEALNILNIDVQSIETINLGDFKEEYQKAKNHEETRLLPYSRNYPINIHCD